MTIDGRFRRYSCATLVCTSLVSPSICAGTVDIDALVRERLFAHNGGTVFLHTGAEQRAGLHFFCRKDGAIIESRSLDANQGVPLNPRLKEDCYVSVKNISLEPQGVIYSQMIVPEMSNNMVREIFPYINCSDSPLLINDSKSISYNESTTISSSTTITSSDTASSGISASIPINVASFQLNNSISIGINQSDTDGKSNTVSQTKTINQNISQTVPAWSIYTVTFDKMQTPAYVKFDGEILFDADVEVRWHKAPERIAKNYVFQFDRIHQTGKLSKFLDEKSRMFTIKGNIWNTQGLRVSRKVESNLIIDRSICEGRRGTNNDILHNLISKSERIIPLTNGMTITTDNSVGNVYVRAKSMGPGFCEVGIRESKGQSLSILATPLMWSDWSALFTHIGSTTTQIYVDVACDTGALLEAKYWSN